VRDYVKSRYDAEKRSKEEDEPLIKKAYTG
jgi:hypothetical protein